MYQTCFNCGYDFQKKLEKGHSVMLPKTCPFCKKLAPRASMRPMMPVRKPKKNK